MKLHRTTEATPRRTRAREVVRPEAEEAVESPIPWEAMAQRFKPEFTEFIEQAKSGDALTTVYAILLLFPELAQRLDFSEQEITNLTTFEEGFDDYSLLLELIEIFPQRRRQIIDALRQAIQNAEKELGEAASEQPPNYFTIFYLLSNVPLYFDQYKDLFTQSKEALLQSIQVEDQIYNVLENMANLVLFFPDLREEVQEVLVKRRAEVIRMLDTAGTKEPVDDLPNTHAFAWSLTRLKMIYAESAGFREDGTIFIEDKKRPLAPASTLPTRNLTS